MMFFKAVFALYLAAIALAAPKRELIEVGDVGTLPRGSMSVVHKLINSRRG
jgi:hypothetical protein